MDNAILFFTVVFFTYWLLGKIFPKKKKVTYVEYPKPEMVSSKLASDPELLKSFIKILAEVGEEMKQKTTSVDAAPDDDVLIKELVRDVTNEMRPKLDTDDAVTALKKLGYKANDIKRAIDIISQTTEPLKPDEIVKHALTLLNK